MRVWCVNAFVGIVSAVLLQSCAATSVLRLFGYRRVQSALWASCHSVCITPVVGMGERVWYGVPVTSTHGPRCFFFCVIWASESGVMLATLLDSTSWLSICISLSVSSVPCFVRMCGRVLCVCIWSGRLVIGSGLSRLLSAHESLVCLFCLEWAPDRGGFAFLMTALCYDL